MGKKSDILTSDNKHLRLLNNGIEVDKELPKYTLIREEVERFKERNMPSNVKLNNLPINVDSEASDIRAALKEQEDIKDAMRDYNRIRVSNVRDLNIFINKHMFDDVFSSFNLKPSGILNSLPNIPIANAEFEGITVGSTHTKNDKKHPILQRLSDLLKSKVKSKELEDMYSLNVLEFFAQVKGLTKINKSRYVNRLAGYIIALKNCDISGQIAMKEKLLRDMVINKYESVLYANSLYYVITEEQIVDFVKKTEDGVRLTYVKNYMRVIPQDVVDKIIEYNKLEIFDNYAILHYDPDYMSYGETIAETKKRQDPILFGLIRGSDKLYYICDWIDEFCNLTLETFVEVLQIDKESLKMEEKISV